MKFASRPLLSEQNTLQKPVEEQKIFKFFKKLVFFQSELKLLEVAKKAPQSKLSATFSQA